MPKFRKKPVVIDAEQYVEYGKLVKGMCNSLTCFSRKCDSPHVHTIHNNQIVLLEIGDWIIPEPDDEHFYPCKSDIFPTIYEPVNERLMNVYWIFCALKDRGVAWHLGIDRGDFIYFPGLNYDGGVQVNTSLSGYPKTHVQKVFPPADLMCNVHRAEFEGSCRLCQVE